MQLYLALRFTFKLYAKKKDLLLNCNNLDKLPEWLSLTNNHLQLLIEGSCSLNRLPKFIG
jgi:hypothetical protein